MGADRTAVNRMGYDALYFASWHGYLDIVKLLLEGNTAVFSTASVDAAMRAACSNGRVEVVRFLIAQGADINAKTRSNEGLLALAYELHSPTVMVLLLANGADVKDTTRDGDYILVMACGLGKVAKVKLLS